MTEAILVLGVGLAAGVLAGMFGVGGGILFVPMLVTLGLDQHQAEATSLLAIIPTVAAGTWRNDRYGNVRWRAALLLGLGSIGGAFGGAALAQALPERTLRLLFAGLMLVTAVQLTWRALRR